MRMEQYLNSITAKHKDFIQNLILVFENNISLKFPNGLVLLLVLLAYPSFVTANTNFEIPDFSQEPGINPQRDYSVNSTGTEIIDPFTGSLRLNYKDLVIPGNGGLDIVINRNYQIVQETQGIAGQTPYLHGSTTTGMGWDIHFGRVYFDGGFGVGLFPSGCEAVVDPVSSTDNPVLELPDGTKKVLFLKSPGIPGTHEYITKDRWVATCIDETIDGQNNGGLLVTSPDGIQYKINYLQRSRVPTSTFTAPALHTTEIKDRNGNWIKIKYKSYSTSLAEIKELTSSDNRKVTFTYSSSGSSNARLTTISANGQTWRYNYVNSAVSGYSYLNNVTGPDGLKWQYTYYNSGLGLHSVKDVTEPYGGKTAYTYQRKLAALDTVAPIISTIAIKTKKTSGTNVSPGTWNYTFSSSGNLSLTTITAPDKTVKYEHCGEVAAYNNNPSVCGYNIGKLVTKKIFDGSSLLQEESYSWSKVLISNQKELYPTRGIFNVDVSADNLVQKTIIRDGSSYITNYSSHDVYGNPAIITETSNSGTKSTSNTYYTNTSKWIINQNKNEILTNDSVNNNKGIVRTFDSNGNLDTEADYGKSTNYNYYLSGANTGEIQSITDPNGNTTSFSYYKRGLPGRENHPEGVTINRIINNSGTIKSETNGRSKTTSFTYDGLNRVKSLSTPRTTDSNIVVTESFTGRKKDIARGGFKQTENYDGFGRIISTNTEGIIITSTYDAAGRLIFESYPGSSKGISYQYDALGRIKKKTFTADNSFITNNYLSNNVVDITNQRGYKTKYTYRAYGDPDDKLLVRIVQPESTTDISRTIRGDILNVTQGGLTRTYIYDSRYLLDRIINPETGLTDLLFDDGGNKTQSKVGSSGITYYGYDNLNRLKSINYPLASTPDVNYTYDKNSNVKSIEKGSAADLVKWDYIYDNNDNLQSETLQHSSKTYSTSYGYDRHDYLQTITTPSDLLIDYKPDDLGRPTKAGSFASSITYHPNGQMKRLTYANGKTVTFDLNQKQLVEKISASSVVSLDYKYDFVGNVLSIDDRVDSKLNRDFTYDKNNRLKTAKGVWGNNGLFIYNARGDITSKRLGPSNISYSYTGNGVLDSVNGIDGAGFRGYSYDSYGNVTNDWQHSYTYGDDGNLLSTDSDNITFTYDGHNRRVSKTVDGITTYFVYDHNGLLTYEEDVSGISQRNYIRVGSYLIAQREECVNGDSDLDQIDDCDEILLGLDPTNTIDASLDLDGDGLSNLQEYLIGSSLLDTDSDDDGLDDKYESDNGLDLLNPDTDGDQIPDGYEVDNNTNPAVDDAFDDADTDGVSNFQEYEFGTDSTTGDTDGDTLTDKFEIDNGLNPLYSDTDCDGMPDGFEITNTLDPQIDDGQLDQDNDSYTNIREYRAGSDLFDALSKPNSGTVQGYYDIGEGRTHWDDEDSFISPEGSDPAIGPDGTVYIATDRLYAFYAEGGSLKWDLFIDKNADDIYEAFISQDDVVPLSCPEEGPGNKGWKSATFTDNQPSNNLEYYAPAIGRDGSIYFSASDGNLYAISSNGALKWVAESVGSTSSPTISIEGVIYVGSGSSLHSIDSATGITNWSALLDMVNGVSPKPSIGGDGTIYIFDKSGFLHAVNPDGTNQSITNPNWPVQAPRLNNDAVELSATPVINTDGSIIITAWEGNFNYNLMSVDRDGTQKYLAALQSTEPGNAHGDPILTNNIVDSPGGQFDAGLAVISTYGLKTVHKLSGLVTSGPFSPFYTAETPAIDAQNLLYLGGAGGLYKIPPTVGGPFITYDSTSAVLVEPITEESCCFSRPAIGKHGSIYLALRDRLYVFNSSEDGVGDSSWPMFGHDARRTSDIRTGLNGLSIFNITLPFLGGMHNEGDPIVFAGNAYDIQDGDISSTITWTSSIDGLIGVGQELTSTTLSEGAHEITASVLDSNSETTDTLIRITVCGALDSDGDGLPDCIETYWGFDPFDATSGGIEDTDKDGLTNSQEFSVDTNMFDNDTDNDGMPDGYEVANLLDPLLDDANDDADGDLIINILEYTFGSNVQDSSAMPGVTSRGAIKWSYQIDTNLWGNVLGQPALSIEGKLYLTMRKGMIAVDPLTATASQDVLLQHDVVPFSNISTEWTYVPENPLFAHLPQSGGFYSAPSINSLGDIQVSGWLASPGQKGAIYSINSDPAATDRLNWVTYPDIGTFSSSLPPIIGNSDDTYFGYHKISTSGVPLRLPIKINGFIAGGVLAINRGGILNRGETDEVVIDNVGRVFKVERNAKRSSCRSENTLLQSNFQYIRKGGKTIFARRSVDRSAVSKIASQAGQITSKPASRFYANNFAVEGPPSTSIYQSGGGYSGGWSPPAPFSSAMFAESACYRNSIIAYYASGTERWAIDNLRDDISAPVVASDGTLYFTSIRYGVIAVNPGTGSLIWQNSSVKTKNSPSIGSDGVIYVTTSNQIVALSSVGEKMWFRKFIDEKPFAPVVAADGTVIVATDKAVYAFNSTSDGLANTPWPTKHHDAQHTSNINVEISNRSNIAMASPLDNEIVFSDQLIDFTAAASDVINGDISDDIEWVSSLQGILGNGPNVASTLVPGIHIISASVGDSFGETISAAITVQSNVPPPNVAPVLSLTSPGDGTSFIVNSAVMLAATAADNEDGDLSTNIQWRSSIDGEIGTGSSLLTNLSVGSHVITLEVTDSAADTTTSQHLVFVYPPDDTDGDSMNDSWELANFGTLDRDGTGDFDGDGITDLQEFLDSQLIANDGDLNGDGLLTVGDMLLLQQHILGTGSLTSEQLLHADTYPEGSGDGTVNMQDYILLQQQVLQ